MSELLIVGSAALDSIKTPQVNKPFLLGGAACYASVAASFFSTTSIVAAVGTDFPSKYIKLLKNCKIDLSDFQQLEGKTFSWAGEYEEDMNIRRTTHLDMGVFESFQPIIYSNNKKTPFVLLSNITPELQLHVLEQMESPIFVMADTIDHHIKNSLPAMKTLLKKIDCFTVNDSEARLLTEENNLFLAAKKIHKMGPSIVIIKKGEHGSIVSYSSGVFLAPAYPLERPIDPTGAGDTFAGALMGYIASHVKTKDEISQVIRQSALIGASTASYCCEGFGFQKITAISKADILNRAKQLEEMISF